MWNRQDEPKVSPAPKQAVAPPNQPTNPEPVSAQSSFQRATQATPQTAAPSADPKARLSVVCKGISINGQVTGSEDLQIDGEVKGTVDLPSSKVMVGPEGKVAGNIQAREIVVRGQLKGNLRASERIFVGQTARWEGDSVSPRVAIEEGAIVSGKIDVVQHVENKHAQSSSTKAAPANGGKPSGESRETKVESPAAPVHHAEPVLAALSSDKSL
jgi:cytoskeletal protein CcmA (bactofilin family)